MEKLPVVSCEAQKPPKDLQGFGVKAILHGLNLMGINTNSLGSQYGPNIPPRSQQMSIWYFLQTNGDLEEVLGFWRHVEYELPKTYYR